MMGKDGSGWLLVVAVRWWFGGDFVAGGVVVWWVGDDFVEIKKTCTLND